MEPVNSKTPLPSASEDAKAPQKAQEESKAQEALRIPQAERPRETDDTVQDKAVQDKAVQDKAVQSGITQDGTVPRQTPELPTTPPMTAESDKTKKDEADKQILPIEGRIFVGPDGTKKILRRKPPLLKVENMFVQFGQNMVLRDINLNVRRGETIAVIGESGCGKTVFLKTLIGLIWPTFGRVLFDGRNLAELSARELVKMRGRYGFVFQMAALFDSMTIADNVTFPLRQFKNRLSRREMSERVDHLLHEVGLNSNIKDRMPSELSGGMRKRVGFARALAMDPEIMLYDEPTTGLDPIMSDVINELIISARDKHNVTGIIVTHDMVSAKKVADRIIMLYPVSRLSHEEPQIIFDGTPEEIEVSKDQRVIQFIHGQAGERLMEMAQESSQ